MSWLINFFLDLLILCGIFGLIAYILHHSFINKKWLNTHKVVIKKGFWVALLIGCVIVASNNYQSVISSLATPARPNTLIIEIYQKDPEFIKDTEPTLKEKSKTMLENSDKDNNNSKEIFSHAYGENHG